MNTRMTILYPPTIDWHFMKQRPQQILTQFAKHGWRVLYANKTQIKGRPPTIVKPNLEIHHDWEALLRRRPRVDVLWISCAVHKDLDIQAAITVFDSLDDFDTWDPYEPEMLARSDIVFTSSEALYRKQSARHNNVVMLRNACDPEFIRPQKKAFQPLEFRKNVKRPVLGFVGAIGSWVDINLLGKLAEHYTVIVVGPNFGKTAPPKTINFGMKDYHQLPRYYSVIDIGIVPFLLNKVSIAANPIKMYEYLAAGKPVVATDIPECRLYPEAVFPSKTFFEFCANIKKAQEVSPETARKIALENTWEIRFKTIQREIEKLL